MYLRVQMFLELCQLYQCLHRGSASLILHHLGQILPGFLASFSVDRRILVGHICVQRTKYRQRIQVIRGQLEYFLKSEDCL